eukprot:7514398-Karenia_brevis.AAC.1
MDLFFWQEMHFDVVSCARALSHTTQRTHPAFRKSWLAFHSDSIDDMKWLSGNWRWHLAVQ